MIWLEHLEGMADNRLPTGLFTDELVVEFELTVIGLEVWPPALLNDLLVMRLAPKMPAA